MGDEKFIYCPLNHISEFNMAIVDYDTAIALDPQDTLAFQARGLTKLFKSRSYFYYRNGEDSLDKALASLAGHCRNSQVYH